MELQGAAALCYTCNMETTMTKTPKQQHETKLAQLKYMMAVGDTRAALKLAASWGKRGLGAHGDLITQGWSAASNPDFYRQIKKDPEALVAAGVQAIRDRYGI